MTACPHCGYDPDPVESTPITSMGLKTRLVNALHAERLYTVGDVLRWQAASEFNRLTWLPNFGGKSLTEWQAALKQLTNDGNVTGRKQGTLTGD
jgi:DNA-directed RNA polymerase alpha subunit